MWDKRFQGTGVAMVTPMNDDGSIDFSSLEQLTNHLVEGGVDFLVVMGTTGESATLNAEEKKNALQTVKGTNNGRIPIVLGIGGNNTASVVKEIQETELDGIDAILSVSPYYNKPTQEGIYQHYAALANATDKSIILYNVPSRTGSNMLPSTTLRLANDFNNIIAIKEASPDITQSMELILNKPKDFLIISGDDALTFPFMACGGDGVISVVANAFPKEFSQMVKASYAGNTSEARKIHYDFLQIIDQLFVEGNPAGIKAALNHIGIGGPKVRLPLVPMSENGQHTLSELINALD